jgi:hypothetical protein
MPGKKPKITNHNIIKIITIEIRLASFERVHLINRNTLSKTNLNISIVHPTISNPRYCNNAKKANPAIPPTKINCHPRENITVNASNENKAIHQLNHELPAFSCADWAVVESYDPPCAETPQINATKIKNTNIFFIFNYL